jgi:hypothetical protein
MLLDTTLTPAFAAEAPTFAADAPAFAAAFATPIAHSCQEALCPRGVFDADGAVGGAVGDSGGADAVSSIFLDKSASSSLRCNVL